MRTFLPFRLLAMSRPWVLGAPLWPGARVEEDELQASLDRVLPRNTVLTIYGDRPDWLSGARETIRAKVIAPFKAAGRPIDMSDLGRVMRDVDAERYVDQHSGPFVEVWRKSGQRHGPRTHVAGFGAVRPSGALTYKLARDLQPGDRVLDWVNGVPGTVIGTVERTWVSADGFTWVVAYRDLMGKQQQFTMGASGTRPVALAGFGALGPVTGPDFMVHRFRLIGTNVCVYDAYEPDPNHTHSSYTHVNGQRWGLITSRNPPRTSLPGGHPTRVQMVQEHYASMADVSRRVIKAAFRETRQSGTRWDGGRAERVSASGCNEWKPLRLSEVPIAW